MSITPYNPQAIEEKWQKFWEEHKLFLQTEGQEVDDQADPSRPGGEKLYLLFAFAYPSGSGLHVGHVESKTALDIMARYYRMQGKKVFFPVGWDAFGLPAENYAIKTGVPPVETTKNAIDTFRRQIKRLAISYDWANEIATCHPGYYKWTQWLFLQLYNAGLAYRAGGMVNWCPSCQTVLANEQVVNGACERCGTEVIQKEMEQWFFKITDYVEELISGLDQVDWPTPTKQQQLHWIGKSEGVTVTFEVADSDVKIDCFTTWPTNWGATFLVLAPEHSAIDTIATPEQRAAVDAYLEEVKSKSESERTRSREKTGVFTGAYVMNHVTGEKMPIWISDFVMGHVGTGAIQGCPGHDQRDWEFATKFGIDIPRVVVGPDGDTSPVDSLEKVIEKGMPGTFINSDFINGMTFEDGIQKTKEYFVEKGWAKWTTTYRLRDWLISRQRYWGAPIPIVYDPEGKPHPVKEEHLPWTLPTDVEFKPTGESPLTHSKEFIERTEALYGKGWRPEFDTMDTFVDSSWYYLRYVSARNEEEFSSKDQLAKWLPVDFYMIGPEHIVLHLLYARFFTKFLRDQGYIHFDEPFMKMRHQGMILGPDGRKMSKSKGNVINPDDVVEKFGADTLRVYEMFMGPIEADKPWDVGAVGGAYRFLSRVHNLIIGWVETGATRRSPADAKAIGLGSALQRKLHQTIRKITADIPALKFNTSIAAMMELVNVWEASVKATGTAEVITKDEVISFLKLLAPFAPFLAEELYKQVQNASENSIESIHTSSWPRWDEQLAVEESITIGVQVNGKVRGELVIDSNQVADKEAVLTAAQELSSVSRYLEGQIIVNEIYVPGKIVSFVIS